MRDNVIYVERERYNGFGESEEREGGHVFAICLVIGFVVFLVCML